MPSMYAVMSASRADSGKRVKALTAAVQLRHRLMSTRLLASSIGVCSGSGDSYSTFASAGRPSWCKWVIPNRRGHRNPPAGTWSASDDYGSRCCLHGWQSGECAYAPLRKPNMSGRFTTITDTLPE